MTGTILHALIVDDDPNARERLRFLLASHSEIRVVGEADSVTNAAALCNDLHPQLIFLDVEMPGGDGFSLFYKIDPLPAVIFITAYDEFAVRAFEVNAVDYLLKPVNPLRLSDAIRRLIYEPPRIQTAPFRPNDRVFLPHDRKSRVVHLPDISGVKAQENYTDVLIADGSTVFMRRTISEWGARLPKSLFFCAHRSLIVNLQAVEDVLLVSRNELTFRLNGHAGIFSLGREAGTRLRKALRQSRGL